ncbi:unnamed protein product [Orchesella dallaii]|uniref:Carboxylesterase type B domain-containing protein n=1 Tax=Orchesella dallaii TaxID=48710 RepID=A0ABP1QDH2_9HEXA
MKQMLILLSIIAISCQNANENTTSETTLHFLPAPLPLHGVEPGSHVAHHDGEHLPQVLNKEDFGGTSTFLDGFSGPSQPSGGTDPQPPPLPNGPSRSRIIETKYGKVQGLSLTLFPQHQSQQQQQQSQGKSSSNSLKNKIVEVFLSIPYASPPIKSHRFSPTQTPIPWDGVRLATKPGFVCPQMMPDISNETAALKEMPKGYLEYLRHVEPFLRNQSEDCLYLNIFAPIGPEPKVRPVIVYIHGGKFAWGSGNLSDGTVFAAYADVVFVTINYRLGVLGFLNVNPTTKPRVANYGLMDQIAALHWIKENILNFGGDPENITLMGYEAGAACIHFLMSSPAVTPGLFHRSILIAGSSYAPWALVSDPRAAAAALAQSLNCSSPGSSSSVNLSNAGSGSNARSNTTSSHVPLAAPPVSTIPQVTRESSHGKSSSSHAQDPVFECLKNRPFADFAKFSPPKFAVDFGPSIDGVVIKPNFRVVLDSQMGKRDVSKKYDLLFGLSSFEKMLAFSQADLEYGFEQARRDAILRTLIRNSYRFHLSEILATITNEYTDWENSVQHPVTIRNLTVSAVTDCLSLAPVIAVAESSLVNRAFFYVFDHTTKTGLYNYQRVGAGGGEELNYMLGSPLVEAVSGHVLPFVPPPIPSNYTKTEMALSELMITYLSNFAHTGDPNEPLKTSDIIWPISKERNRFKTTKWEPHDRFHQKLLEISANKLRTRNHYRAHQMAIWLRLVPELQRSGAQFASTLHNRMKGGNDPNLYVGNVRSGHEGDDIILSGAGPSIFGVMGYGDEIIEPPDSGIFSRTSGNQSSGLPSPPTTCFSPLASSSSPAVSGRSKNGRANETSPLESSFFSPYSTALSVTIAIGCSLLILNVFIFALVYYQRDKRRAEMMKSVQQQNSDTSISSKYGEPPELLKSNSTTATSLHMSVSQGQLHPLQISQQHSTDSTVSCHSRHGGPHSCVGSPVSETTQKQLALAAQQQQLSLSQRGILLNPSQTHQQHQQHLHQFHHGQGHLTPQMLAVATLPRSNGGIGVTTSSGLPKPPPPPRSFTNFSTLPHSINKSNQNLSSNFDELKV